MTVGRRASTSSTTMRPTIAEPQSLSPQADPGDVRLRFEESRPRLKATGVQRLNRDDAWFFTRVTVPTAGLRRCQADRSNPVRLMLLDRNDNRNCSAAVIKDVYKLRMGSTAVRLTAQLLRDVQYSPNEPDAVSRGPRPEKTDPDFGMADRYAAAGSNLQVGYRFFRHQGFFIEARSAHDDPSPLTVSSLAAITGLKGLGCAGLTLVGRSARASFRRIGASRSKAISAKGATLVARPEWRRSGKRALQP